MLLFPFIGFAANTINYNPISIKSGTIVTLPVNVNLDENYQDLQLTLIYNNRVIDVKSIESSNTSDITTNFSHRLDTGIININFSKNLGSNVNLNFKLEGLSYFKDITEFTILYFKLDGIDIVYEQNANKINIIGDSIMQGTPYNLMQNYPNPFNDYTTFNFSLNNDGEVQFKVFDASGQEVLDNTNIKESIKIYQMHIGGGETEMSSDTYYLKKGKYRLDFNPLDNYFAAGVYYFTIKVNDVFLSKPFIYYR